LTFQKAANTVPSGSTVYGFAGVYPAFRIDRPGIAGKPITFTSFPGERAVIDGRGIADYTVKVFASYIRLVGLTVQGGFLDRQQGGGVIVSGVSSVEIRESLLTENKAFGVRVYNSTNVIVDDNDITKNAVGVQVNHAGEGVVISDNIIHRNDKMMINTVGGGDDAGAEGIALVRSTGRVIVERNRIWANRAQSYDFGYDGGAVSIYAASNWVIRNNVTWDSRNVLETGTDANRTACNNGQFVRNVNYGATTVDRTVGMVLRCASNTLVAHNTFDDIQFFGFAVDHLHGNWGGPVDGLRIVNNIIRMRHTKVIGINTWPLPSTVDINYNLWYTGQGELATVATFGSTTSMPQFVGWTGYERNGLYGLPRLNPDYSLQPDSPAVDRAIRIPGINDGFIGAAPDMGAIESH
jgi:hypothetical protein